MDSSRRTSDITSSNPAWDPLRYGFKGLDNDDDDEVEVVEAKKPKVEKQKEAVKKEEPFIFSFGNNGADVGEVGLKALQGMDRVIDEPPKTTERQDTSRPPRRQYRYQAQSRTYASLFNEPPVLRAEIPRGFGDSYVTLEFLDNNGNPYRTLIVPTIARTYRN